MPRVYTLQDTIKGLQRQIDRLANPTQSAAAIIDQVVATDESFGTTDSVSSLTSATPNPLWGTSLWGEEQWLDSGLIVVAGQPITDVNRALALNGTPTLGTYVDGLSGDLSYAVYDGQTNLHRRGQCDVWTSSDNSPTGGGTTTIAVDTSVAAPFSPRSFKVTTDGLAISQGSYCRSATGQGAAAGVLAAGSVYMKGVAGQTYEILTGWDHTDSTQANGTPLLVTATGAWQLVTPPTTPVATGKTGDRAWLIVRTHTARAESFWIAHGMVQKGLNAVYPYIPTSGGSPATAVSNFVSVPLSALPAGAVSTTTGWAAAAVRPGFASSVQLAQTNAVPFSIDDGTNSERLQLVWQSVGGQWQVRSCTGGVCDTSPVSADTFAANALRIVYMAWDATHLYLSINGASVSSAARTKLPGTTTGLRLGTGGIGNQFCGRVHWIVFGRNPTTASPSTLNGYGATLPANPWSIPGRPSFVWTASGPTYILTGA